MFSNQSLLLLVALQKVGEKGYFCLCTLTHLFLLSHPILTPFTSWWDCIVHPCPGLRLLTPDFYRLCQLFFSCSVARFRWHQCPLKRFPKGKGHWDRGLEILHYWRWLTCTIILKFNKRLWRKGDAGTHTLIHTFCFGCQSQCVGK